MPRTISCPYSGCSSMTRRSSGVSGPSLRNSRVGTPSLPTSWRIPAKRSASVRSSSMPSSRAISSGRTADPFAVAARVAVLDVDGLHQRPDRGLVGAALPVVLREHPAADVHRQQHEERGDRSVRAAPQHGHHQPDEPVQQVRRRGPRELARARRPATRSRSAAARTAPSSAVTTTQKVSAAAEGEHARHTGGHGAYGTVGPARGRRPAADQRT